jgi:TIR domain
MDIFPVNEAIWHFAGAWHHIAKIHEEIAEIHEAYSSYKKGGKPKEAVTDEVADVLAWMLGAWGILYPNRSLDDVFIDYYFDGCPLCKSMPCQCDLYDSRPDSLIDFKRLALLKENLASLVNALPQYQEDLSELIKSYDYVLETHNAPMAKVSVSQTKDKLEKIKGMIAFNEIDPKSLTLINTILDISEAVLRLEEAQPGKTINYDVFLSYSTLDKDEAREIFSLLTQNNLKVFLSEKEIKPSSKWENDIKEALSSSKLLCILATPNSLKSEWVTTEWGAAWVQNIRILPVLLQCSARDLPERLREYQAINFHEMAKIIEILKS